MPRARARGICGRQAAGKLGTANVAVQASNKTVVTGTVLVTVSRGSEVVGLANSELAKGKAKLSIAALPAGVYMVVAEYQGTSTFTPSSSSSVEYVVGNGKSQPGALAATRPPARRSRRSWRSAREAGRSE